jgi:hypothetical protein
MDACVLSAEEIGRLRHYGISPNHDEHHHISASEAIAGILDDTYELIEHEGRVFVTRARLYFIRPVKSAGIPVIQRIVSNQLTILHALR